MSNQEFKKGDRVEFIEDYNSTVEEGEQGTVTAVETEDYSEDSRHATQLIYVELDSGTRTGCFNFRLKRIEQFKAGDRVVSAEYPEFGEMRVLEKLGARSVFRGQYRCEGNGHTGVFEAEELEHAAQPPVEAEEQEAEAQPVTFRICVGTTMGTTEYPSLEAAKEAALTHGNAKEEFSIFEVVKIADYRVKVTKELEAV